MNEMNITSAQYVTDEITNQTSCIKAVIGGEVIFVPNNGVANRHYAEIMRQIAAGELTIADAD
mgnify:CR=1 FL=1